MTERHFEDKNFVKTYALKRPYLSKKVAQAIIDFVKESPRINTEHMWDLMVDVGCGSGQSSQIFSSYFSGLIGIDISPKQIEFARERNQCSNVVYKVSQAEKLDVANNSVDLVTAIEAAHWFDLEKFYQEAHRVLKPEGVVALCGHAFPISAKLLDSLKPLSSTEEMNSIWMNFYSELDKSQRDEYIFQEYRNLPQPKHGFHTCNGKSCIVPITWSINNAVGFASSLSCFSRLAEKNPEKALNVIKILKKHLIDTLKVDEDLPLTFEFEYFLVFLTKV